MSIYDKKTGDAIRGSRSKRFKGFAVPKDDDDKKSKPGLFSKIKKLFNWDDRESFADRVGKAASRAKKK